MYIWVNPMPVGVVQTTPDMTALGVKEYVPSTVCTCT